MLIQYGRKMTLRKRRTPAVCAIGVWPGPLLSSEFDFASGCGLQLAQSIASDLFRMFIAFSFVFELQACPPIGVQGLEVGAPEATIGRRLWRKQGAIGTTHWCLRPCWRRSGVHRVGS